MGFFLKKLYRDNGKSIEFLKDSVRKIYHPDHVARLHFLATIYSHLSAKGVPNVDRLKKLKTTSPRGCYAELEPRGIDHGPQSADDVKNAVMCILSALKVLHFTHCHRPLLTCCLGTASFYTSDTSSRHSLAKCHAEYY